MHTECAWKLNLNDSKFQLIRQLSLERAFVSISSCAQTSARMLVGHQGPFISMKLNPTLLESKTEAVSMLTSKAIRNNLVN